MRIVKLSVENFRGIQELEWTPERRPLCCLIGHGDSGKSTVLDAIEAALSSRWYIRESWWHTSAQCCAGRQHPLPCRGR